METNTTINLATRIREEIRMMEHRFRMRELEEAEKILNIVRSKCSEIMGNIEAINERIDTEGGAA